MFPMFAIAAQMDGSLVSLIGFGVVCALAAGLMIWWTLSHPPDKQIDEDVVE